MDNLEIKADWKIVKMIFFNFFQNSVKYNEMEGFIKVMLSLMNFIVGEENE